MEIRKAKFPLEAVKLVRDYKRKDVNSIKQIRVQWACKRNKKFLHNFSLNSSNGYHLFSVDLEQLVNSVDFGEMRGKKINPKRLFNGVIERDYRVAKALDHWSRGGYIDPPEMGIDYTQSICFGDGRHRTIAASHIGEKRIPIMVHKSLIKKVSSLIELDSYNE